MYRTLLVAAVVLAAVFTVAPTATACIQVYPYSELCSEEKRERFVCNELDGVADPEDCRDLVPG